jgi:DNA-binding transcriptional LysR family regulator
MISSISTSRAALPSKNRSLSINDYVCVINATLNGQGAALGWRHLTDGLLAEGRLVDMTGHVMRTGSAFYAVWQRDRGL